MNDSQKKANTPEEKQDNSDKRGKKNLLIPVMVFLCFAAAAGTAMLWMAFFIKTPATTSPQEITFTVLSGQNLSTIAQNLKDQKLISSRTAFKFYARIKKATTLIKAEIGRAHV